MPEIDFSRRGYPGCKAKIEFLLTANIIELKSPEIFINPNFFTCPNVTEKSRAAIFIHAAAHENQLHYSSQDPVGQ